MSETLLVYGSVLRSSDGVEHQAHVCGRERGDGRWEAWLEFEPQRPGSATICTPPETTQVDRSALLAWAQGISRVYLEGALTRAAPAGTPRTKPAAPPPPEEPQGVIDPFEVHAHGQSLLRRHLDALSAAHLRHIARAHDMLDDRRVDELTKEELVDTIVTETSRRAVLR